MSGHESSHEPDDLRVEGRPLSPDVHAGHAHPQARANPRDAHPAEAAPGEDEDADRDEESDEPRPSKGRKRRGFKVPALAPTLGLIVSYPRRRRERSAREAEPEGDPRPTSRFSPLAMKTEARVGLAAALSFVLIVGVLVVKKGWLGGTKAPLVTMIPHPTDKDVKGPAVADGKKKEGEARPPAEPQPATGLLGLGANPVGPQSPPSIDPEKLRPLELARTEPPVGEPQSPPAGGPEPAAAPDAPPEKPLDPLDPLKLPGPAPDTASPPTLPAAAPAPDPATPADPPAGSGLEPPPSSLPTMPEVKPDAIPAMPAQEAAPVPVPTPAPADPPAQVSPVVPPPEIQPDIQPEPVQRPAPPRPPIKPPTLETVPAAAIEAPPAAPAPAEPVARSVESLGPGWVVVRSGGKKALSPDASAALGPAPAPSRDGPPVREDAAIADQVEPALHTVQPGENFWSISKLYYRSSRYYKALHAANRKQVPEIGELYVGTVLRIPPPEALDRTLILPPGRPATTDGPAVSRASRQPEPPDEVILSRPIRPSLIPPKEDHDAPASPRRPTYRVKPNETLRSIARDTLGDNKRYREILDLNRDTIEDPRAPLEAGITLTLPEDAVIGRRAR